MYDASLDFGTVDLSTTVMAFPSVLNMGAAEGAIMAATTQTGADRLTVDILCGNAVGAGTLTVTVQGADASGGTFVDVGKNTFTTDELKAGKASVAISPNRFLFLKAIFAKTGITAGNASAWINPRGGK